MNRDSGVVCVLKMTDEELLQAYYDAIELDLDHEFIKLLEEEIHRRKIKITNKTLSVLN